MSNINEDDSSELDKREYEDFVSGNLYDTLKTDSGKQCADSFCKTRAVLGGATADSGTRFSSRVLNTSKDEEKLEAFPNTKRLKNCSWDNYSYNDDRMSSNATAITKCDKNYRIVSEKSDATLDQAYDLTSPNVSSVGKSLTIVSNRVEEATFTQKFPEGTNMPGAISKVQQQNKVQRETNLIEAERNPRQDVDFEVIKSSRALALSSQDVSGLVSFLDARVLPGITNPFPPLASFSRAELFEALPEEVIVDLMLSANKQQFAKSAELAHAGDWPFDLCNLVYNALYNLYSSRLLDDGTQLLFVESILCYLVYYPKEAKRILNYSIGPALAKVGLNQRESRGIDKDERSDKFKRLLEKTQTSMKNSGSRNDSETGSGGPTAEIPTKYTASANTNGKGMEEVDTDRQQRSKIVDGFYERVAPFTRLGTLFNSVVPVEYANISNVSARMDFKQKKTAHHYLQVKFEHPVLLQLCARENVSTKPNISQISHFLSLSSRESEKIFHLLKTRVNLCARLNFLQTVTVCHLKKLQQVDAFAPTERTKGGLKLTPVDVTSIAEQDNATYFIFATDLQIFQLDVPSEATSGEGKPENAGCGNDVTFFEANRNARDFCNSQPYYCVRIFPRPLAHFSKEAFVLAFNMTAGNWDMFERNLT